MFDDISHHVEQTWDHVRHGNSTLGEKFEVAGEALAGVAAVAALSRLGLSHYLPGSAEAVLPKLALTVDQAAAELSVTSSREHEFGNLASRRVSELVSAGEEGSDASSALRGPIQRQLGIGPREREFKVVKGDVRKLLNDLKSDNPLASGKLLLREYKQDGELGPELKTWVQHYGGLKGGVRVNTEVADKADLVITCHPELYGEVHTDPGVHKMLLEKHVFPWAQGEIRLAEGMFSDPAKNQFDTTLIVRGTDTGW